MTPMGADETNRRTSAPAGLVFRRLTPALPQVPLYATYRADDASPVLKLFLDTLRELVDHTSRESVTKLPGTITTACGRKLHMRVLVESQ